MGQKKNIINNIKDQRFIFGIKNNKDKIWYSVKQLLKCVCYLEGLIEGLDIISGFQNKTKLASFYD